MTDGIKITGTGSYLPPKVMTNADFMAMGLDTSDEWIIQRTGIRERRIAEQEVVTSDLALEASRRALEMAGRDPQELDLIVMATVTPDTHCPAAANWLQAKLGASRAATFDVTAACSGFVFALNVAQQYLNSGTARTVLVVAGEIMSRTLNWKNRATCILFGDGAGAMVLERGAGGHQLLASRIHSDGSIGQNLLVPGGGSQVTPITHESVERGDHYLEMIEANKTFRVAVRHFIDAIKEGAEDSDVSVAQIDWFVPHQANERMFKNISQSMGIPMEKFFITIHKYGNISSASCAIALDEAIRGGHIQPGQLICMPVFGGGVTWGHAMLRW
ncbi:MAG: beta-ketoacyl-ACP synthase III [Desulfobacterales bacterium]|jgi:3-oxoacyl-[acyl-carrier-protein] synthase-3